VACGSNALLVWIEADILDICKMMCCIYRKFVLTVAATFFFHSEDKIVSVTFIFDTVLSHLLWFV
jgi:hypothetical protein